MDQPIIVQLTVYIPTLLLLIGMTFAVSIDSYIGKKNKTLLLVIASLLLCLIGCDYYEFALWEENSIRIVRLLVSIVGYSLRPAVLLLFLHIVGGGRRLLPQRILVILNALLHMTALFSGICFTINESGRFVRGPLGYSCHIISGVLLACLVYLTLREYRQVQALEMFLPVANAVVILCAVALDTTVNDEFL